MTPTLSEEAVKAAQNAIRTTNWEYGITDADMAKALTAAAPHLVAERVNSDQIEAARKAVEELAHVQMNLPLEDWSRISSAILSALEPSAGRAAVLEEAARVAEMLPECDLLNVNGNEVSPAVNDAFKRGAFAQGKAIAAAIRALSSPDHADAGKVEGDGWLPIESAPKDGTPVLIAWQAVASVRGEKQWFQTVAHYDDSFEIAGYDEETGDAHKRGAWTDGAVASWAYEEIREISPTHWRPLPSAPSEGAE